MERANVDIIRRTFDAVVAKDWERAVEPLHPDVEIFDDDIPDADCYRGREGYFAWLARWEESWDHWRMEDVAVHPVPDGRVLVLFSMIATGRESGIEIARRDAVSYELVEGQIVRIDYHDDQRSALAAMGLDPSTTGRP